MADIQRYSLSQRLLHWFTALLVIPALAGGILLGTLGFEGVRDAFGMEVTNVLYAAHKTTGVLILVVVLVRLGVRLTLGAPAPAPTLTPVERWASRSVHTLLYLVLIVQPLLGWLATAAGGYPVEFFGWNLPGLVAKDKALSEILFQAHGLLGFFLLLLLGLHIAGALRHWLIKRDGVMRRMSLFS